MARGSSQGVGLPAAAPRPPPAAPTRGQDAAEGCSPSDPAPTSGAAVTPATSMAQGMAGCRAERPLGRSRARCSSRASDATGSTNAASGWAGRGSHPASAPIAALLRAATCCNRGADDERCGRAELAWPPPEEPLAARMPPSRRAPGPVLAPPSRSAAPTPHSTLSPLPAAWPAAASSSSLESSSRRRAGRADRALSLGATSVP
mmetsp:Transcript_8649/g.34127  ORF Transcript_8649/g.34127 Transcript_8649/m.34127 type:complete len:204 (-) Transcript_8649:507-1118(-)